MEKNNFYNSSNKIIYNGHGIETSEEYQKFVSESLLDLIPENEVNDFKKTNEKLETNIRTRHVAKILTDKIQMFEVINNLDELLIYLVFEFYIETESKFIKRAEQIEVEILEYEKFISKLSIENSRWDKMTEEFNKRFSFPFVINIENKTDLILFEELPIINFKYTKNDGTEKKMDLEEGYHILSGGERRALSLLKMLLSIEMIIEKADISNVNQFIFLDDITDSFDYKNKYAITTYLKEITEKTSNRLYFVIFTHNFDFYRILHSRLNVERKNMKRIEKLHNSELVVHEASYIRDYVSDVVFNNIRTSSKVNDENVIYYIAAIPFLRNIELSLKGKSDNYRVLCKYLHLRDEDGLICNIDDYSLGLDSLVSVTNDLFQLEAENEVTDLYTNILGNTTNNLLANTDELDLQQRMLLSINIRLLVEDTLNKVFLCSESKKFSDEVVDERSNGEVFIKFQEGCKTCRKKECPFSLKCDKHADYMSELTEKFIYVPEHIHANSFLIEPLLDVSAFRLKDICKNVQVINHLVSRHAKY